MHTQWNGPNVTFIDMLFCLMLVFLGLAVLASVPQPKQDAGDVPICSMAVDIEWPEDTDTDVDLWVRSGNERPVGYSARDGDHFDLVRDDLGRIREGNGPNTERACGRGFVDGEYVVNVHLYRVPVGELLPIPVNVSVKLVNPSTAYMQEIWSGAVSLDYVGHERTVIRFVLNSGKLVSGSFNEIPIILRTMQ